MSNFVDNDGANLRKNELVTTDYFGKPKLPIPGSSFTLPKSALSGGARFGGENGNFYTPKKKMRQVNDQMINIALSHGHGDDTSSFFGFPVGTMPPFSGNSPTPSLGGFNKERSSLLNTNRSIFSFRGTEVNTSKYQFSDSENTSLLGFQRSLQNFGFDFAGFGDEEEMSVVMGHRFNGHIPGAEYIVVAPHKTEAPGKYDLTFISAEPLNEGSSNFYHTYTANLLYGYGRNFAPHNGYTLASLNWKLAESQLYTFNPTGNVTPPGRQTLETEFLAHSDLLSNYQFLGVCNSEQYRDGGASYMDGVKNSTMRKDMQEEKALNVVMSGAVRQVKNIWGPVSAGTHLFLIWKKIDTQPNVPYILDTKVGNMEWMFGPDNKQMIATAPSNKTLSNKPFQLVPWCTDEYNTPPMEILEYTSDVADPTSRKRFRKHVGSFIYIGMVLHVDTAQVELGQFLKAAKREERQKSAVKDYRTGTDELIQILIMSKHQGGDKMMYYPPHLTVLKH